MDHVPVIDLSGLVVVPAAAAEATNHRPTNDKAASPTPPAEYASSLYRLNQLLNSLLMEALQLDQQDEPLCHELTDEPFCVLKQMKYSCEEVSDPSQGKFGAGAHTDWGAFTILATDDTPGLQIYNNDGEWLPVPPKPGCFIINSGDQISQLTNGYYKSALHRVVTTTTARPRYSTAFFTYFGIHATIRPLPRFVEDNNDDGGTKKLKYPSPQTTLEYFHFKLHESMMVGHNNSGTAAA